MSTCVVDKDLVIKAVKKALKHVKYYRAKCWNKLIQKEMNRKWFKSKTVSQAAKRVKNSEMFVESWRIGKWGLENQAKTLLSASSVCSCDVMTLDIDDARFVARWINE